MRSGCGTSVLAIPDTLSADLYGLTQFSSLFSLTSKDGQIVYNEKEIDSIMLRATAFAIGMGMGNGDAENIVKHVSLFRTGVCSPHPWRVAHLYICLAQRGSSPRNPP